MTDDLASHDHLFKEVLGQFFPEFIELFFPDVAEYLDRDSIQFEPLELFANLTDGQALATDLVVKAKFQQTDSYFIIHVEHQANFDRSFDRRMFQYFALLDRDYALPVYPIVIFSRRSPQAIGDRSYSVSFPGWEVLQFNYRVIRLNHLRWQDFVAQKNPVASAFMAKMKVDRRDRPLAKLACLRMLAQMKINPAQLLLLSGFIDTYLDLEQAEEQTLQTELDKIGLGEKENVMQIVTSWMREGLAQGLEQGLEQGRSQEQEESRRREARLLLKVLRGKFESVSTEAATAIESLSLEQLDDLADRVAEFTVAADLQAWLVKIGAMIAPTNP
jgi:Domain of unknown function (DUF4351)/Putative transposase, YhgA-like